MAEKCVSLKTRGALVGKNFLKSPALELGNRLGFNDPHLVADLGFALFVVHVVFLGPLDDLVEAWVRNTSNVLDHKGLVHLVGNDHANASLAKVGTGFLLGLAHGR